MSFMNDTGAAFGRPVVPEVYKSIAMSLPFVPDRSESGGALTVLERDIFERNSFNVDMKFRIVEEELGAGDLHAVMDGCEVIVDECRNCPDAHQSEPDEEEFRFLLGMSTATMSLEEMPTERKWWAYFCASSRNSSYVHSCP